MQFRDGAIDTFRGCAIGDFAMNAILEIFKTKAARSHRNRAVAATNVLRMGTSYPQSENENSNFLAKLWQDSIVEYRRTVQPNKINEGVLREPLSVDAQLLTVTSDWDVFRDRNTASTSKTLNRVGNVIHDVLL